MQKRTRTVGLLVPDVANPYYPEIARGVEDVASAQSYALPGGSNRPSKFTRSGIPSQYGTYFAKPGWLKANAGSAERFRAAVTKAHRFMYESKEETVKIVAKATSFSPQVIEQAYARFFFFFFFFFFF